MDKKKKKVSLERVFLNMYLLYIGALLIIRGFEIDQVTSCVIGGIFIWEGIKYLPIFPSSFVAWLFGYSNEPKDKPENKKKEGK